MGNAMDPRDNLVDDDARIGEIVRSAKRIAVLGIKAERHADRPAFYVPAFLKSAGAEIVPVPTYYPEVTEILGEPVHRNLSEVPRPVDILDVFRRPRTGPFPPPRARRRRSCGRCARNSSAH